MNLSMWTKNNTIEQPKIQPWILTEPKTMMPVQPRSLAQCTENFYPITLQEMDCVALLNRVDTKFIMTREQLISVLQFLPRDYRILTIENNCINHYRTLYFDTPDFQLYQLHVNKNAERYKVRYREYLDSCKSFLEVKHKTRKDRTIKDRIPTTQPYSDLTPEAEDWLEGVFPYDSEKLEAKLWNTFSRITLVNEASCERVTLDTDLVFYTQNKLTRMDGLAVAEVKAESGQLASPFMEQMRTRRIHPQSFSKYCMGVALLYEEVKRNEMKSKILKVNKMIKGASIYG